LWICGVIADYWRANKKVGPHLSDDGGRLECTLNLPAMLIVSFADLAKATGKAMTGRQRSDRARKPQPNPQSERHSTTSVAGSRSRA
jgi:hypothetical protein